MPENHNRIPVTPYGLQMQGSTGIKRHVRLVVTVHKRKISTLCSLSPVKWAGCVTCIVFQNNVVLLVLAPISLLFQKHEHFG